MTNFTTCILILNYVSQRSILNVWTMCANKLIHLHVCPTVGFGRTRRLIRVCTVFTLNLTEAFGTAKHTDTIQTYIDVPIDKLIKADQSWSHDHQVMVCHVTNHDYFKRLAPTMGIAGRLWLLALIFLPFVHIFQQKFFRGKTRGLT